MGCERVSPCDVEGLPAAMFVAGHTGSSGCFTLSALVLANITCLQTHTEKNNVIKKLAIIITLHAIVLLNE